MHFKLDKICGYFSQKHLHSVSILKVSVRHIYGGIHIAHMSEGILIRSVIFLQFIQLYLIYAPIHSGDMEIATDRLLLIAE